MRLSNPFTERLGLRYPIVQGPFGGGLSSVRLVADVANAGGLGSYGAHMLSPSQIHTLAGDIRAATQGPFALNLWVSDHDPGGLALSRAAFDEALRLFKPFYDELGIEVPEQPGGVTERYEAQVEALIEIRPPAFSFVFGIPSQEVLGACRARGIVTIGAATTVAEALAVEAAGVDVVLATGFEAGGHRPSFLKPAEESLMGTLALVPQVVDAVDVPVIAAGGIADGRGIAAVLMLGAQAAQLGSAFLACDESATTDLHRRRILSDDARHTVLSRAFTGRLARFIPNRFIREMDHRKNRLLPFPMQSWFTGLIKNAASARDNGEFASLYAGQASPLLSYTKAIELMDALVAELERTMSSRGVRDNC